MAEKLTETKPSGELIEKDYFGAGLGMGFVLGAFLSAIVFYLIVNWKIDQFKQEAIKKGVAEWTVDQNTGEATWRLKGPVYIYKN